MNKTNIEWVKNPDGTQGYTWNPITGCLNNCSYCYARKLANGRLKSRYLANHDYPLTSEMGVHPNPRAHRDTGAYADPIAESDPFYPRFWEDRECSPITFERPRKHKGVFVCDMGELFGDWIPREWQQHIFATIQACPWHRFYLLTKQPQNLLQFSPFPDNCWVGVTATNREKFVSACTYLEKVWAKVKYLSLEPLLDWHNGNGVDIKGYLENAGIGQVIIGSQTKPYKPPKIEWIEEIESACNKARIAVFEKNNLNPLLDYNLRQEMPNEEAKE